MLNKNRAFCNKVYFNMRISIITLSEKGIGYNIASCFMPKSHTFESR